MTVGSMGDELREREAELQALGRELDAVVGGSGRAVLVEGSAGIGKTRLLDELCARADGRARVLRGRGGEPEDVARHLAVADRCGEPWAAQALWRAAEVAGGRGAPEAAVTYLAAALREEIDPALRFRVLLAAGWNAFRARDRRGLGWLEEARRCAPDPASAVRAWAAVWNWRAVVREPAPAAEVLAGLPDELPDQLAYRVQAHFLLDFGFSGAGTRALLDRYPVPTEEPEGRTLAEHLWLSARVADLVVRGRPAAEALAIADRVDVDAVLGSRAADTPNVVWLVLARAGAGDLRGAEALARAGLERNRRSASQMPFEWLTASTAIIQLLRGDVAAAAASMEPWLESEPWAGVPVTEPSVCGALVALHRERGDPGRAWAALARYGYVDAEPPTDWHGAFLLHQRGRLRRDGGDVAGAAADHERCREVMDSFHGPANPYTPWRLGLAACRAATGETEEAGRLLREQVEQARAFGAAPLLGASLRALALHTGGADGIAVAEEAVAVLEGSDARGELARARLVLGRLLRHDRHIGPARDELRAALDLADRLGATRLCAEVEGELALAGVRPRRRAVVGVHALTPAELRVARLAAQGLSNPEIAQSLFVTRKTVEKHLGAAFAKLHISSRDQLDAVLVER